MNSVLVTVFAGFWVRNLTGLPLTLGEPVPRGLSALELQEERQAETARDKTRRRERERRGGCVLWCVLCRLDFGFVYFGVFPSSRRP